jgi:holo-[acyl-carrier protein] synthase
MPEDTAAAPSACDTPYLRVGTDLVATDRIDRLLHEQPELAERVFTPRELAYCAGRRGGRGTHLAARFAAKEAVMKALGTGVARGVEWTDVEIVNQLGGRPTVRLYGAAAKLAGRHRMRQAEVSLTHTAGLALAHVVLVCRPERPAAQARSGGDGA